MCIFPSRTFFTPEGQSPATLRERPAVASACRGASSGAFWRAERVAGCVGDEQRTGRRATGRVRTPKPVHRAQEYRTPLVV
jgi:hypothetical protein